MSTERVARSRANQELDFPLGAAHNLRHQPNPASQRIVSKALSACLRSSLGPPYILFNLVKEDLKLDLASCTG